MANNFFIKLNEFLSKNEKYKQYENKKFNKFNHFRLKPEVIEFNWYSKPPAVPGVKTLVLLEKVKLMHEF